ILDEGQGRFHAVAVRTRPPEPADLTAFSRTIVARCLESAQTFLTDDAGADERLRGSKSVSDLERRSVIGVPLLTPEERVLGAIQIDTRDRARKFSADDLRLLWGVTTQAAVALQNARLHEDLLEREQLERDLEVAIEVQRGLLPEQLPEVAGYDF